MLRLSGPGCANAQSVSRKGHATGSRLARRWAWVLAVVLVLGAGTGYLAWTYGSGGVPGIGERAPGFVLEDGEGRPVSLNDYQGRPVVLVFYMTYGRDSCRVQLGKLRQSIAPIQAAGAEVLAISNDERVGAARMARDLGGAIRVLSEPSMRVIYRYGMKAHNMAMARMGYVLIDRAGMVPAREPEPRFGERVDDIVAVLRESTVVKTGGG